ncbi:hypothetical protein J3T91_09135, partial [Bifidobacterium sp. B4001]|uniref:hypothetical protein n=1 Tax=unclassified Bifidobacterium TaxID=2608897 RepID=UPI00226BA4A4
PGRLRGLPEEQAGKPPLTPVASARACTHFSNSMEMKAGPGLISRVAAVAKAVFAPNPDRTEEDNIFLLASWVRGLSGGGKTLNGSKTPHLNSRLCPLISVALKSKEKIICIVVLYVQLP